MKNCPNCGAYLPEQAGKKEPVSVGGWIGRTLIPCIPLVGGLIYLIMLFVWSGDQKKEESFRNWAKAQLIVLAIVIVLALVIAVVFGASIASMMEYM